MYLPIYLYYYTEPGMPVLFGGHNLPPLVEMELTDLPKSWTLLTKCDLGRTQILSIASKLTEHVIYIYTRNQAPLA